MDPAYEAKINRVALPTPRSAEDEDEEGAGEKAGWKDVFGGSWGVTPLAGVGPNGTRVSFNMLTVVLQRCSGASALRSVLEERC